MKKQRKQLILQRVDISKNLTIFHALKITNTSEL